MEAGNFGASITGIAFWTVFLGRLLLLGNRDDDCLVGMLGVTAICHVDTTNVRLLSYMLCNNQLMRALPMDHKQY